MRRILKASVTVALAIASLGVLTQPLSAQSTPPPDTVVSYADDFQSYGAHANPPGWVDNAIGKPAPVADGLYKTWPDPLQGNQAANIVYGTKQSSGKPDGNTPRIGTFSTYTAKSFAGKGRFEYRGRFIRTSTDTRIGLTVFSSYPDADKYYLFGLWQQPGGTLSMQLFGFGAGTLTGTTDSNFTPAPGTWYRFTIQADDINNTTFLRARFWQDGKDEPATWSIDAQDATTQRLSAGHIGLWSAVKGDAYIDDITAKSPVDHTPPVITFVDADSGKKLDPATLALFPHVAHIDVQVTDDLSGVGSTTLTLDGATYVNKSDIGDGTHVLKAHAVDNAGNASDATLNLLVNTKPPVITLLINGQPFTDGQVFSGNVTLSATVTDATTTTTAATVDDQPATLPLPIAGEQLHKVTVTATDQVGLQTTTPVTSFYVDKSAPVITIFANGTQLSSGATFQSDVTLTWTITDLTLDPASVVATLDGAPVQSGVVVSAEAIHTISVTAGDKAGHSTTVSQSFPLDKSKPQVEILANGKSFVDGSSYNLPVSFTLNVVDATPTTQTITIDGNAYTAGTPVTAEAKHTISVSVVNAAGGTTNLGPFNFTIDLTAPVLSLTESGTPFTDGMKFSRDVNPVVTATDNFTQSPTITLLVDGRSYTIGSPITSESADHTIAASAVDAAGNSSSVGPFHFVLDKTPPVVTVTDDAGNSVPANALVNHAVTLLVKVVDVTTSPATATLNGSPFDLGTGTKQTDGSVVYKAVISGDNVDSFVASATDVVGHTTTAPAVTFTIDTTPPTISFTSPADKSVISTPTVLVQGNAGDAVSVKVNGKTADVTPGANGAPGTFAITGVQLLEGENSVIATGTDLAGNTSAPITLKLNVDTHAPQLAITSPAGSGCTSAASIDLQGTVSDPNLQGVTAQLGTTTVNATVDASGNWTASFPNVAEGKDVFAVTATDSVGHASTATVTVNVDRTKPVVSMTESGLPFTATLVNRGVSLFIRVTDADPSPALTATIDGAAYAQGTSITAEGTHTIGVTATDCAGNSAQISQQFTIDRTPPQLSNFSPANASTVGSIPTAIRGTASEAATVSINGTAFSASTDASNNFVLSGVPFLDGANQFVLHAVDRAGNASDTAYNVTVRSKSPVVTISENGVPMVAGTTYNRVVTPVVSANANDDTVTAQLNGNAFTSGTAISADGNYTLTATANDPVGHTANASVTFTIDRTPPVVKITSPADGATIDADSVAVTVNAPDAASVIINGATATGSGGNFTASVPLDGGSNLIIATGTDAAGNRGSAQITVNRAGTGTGVLLTYPPEGFVTNRPTILVTGRVLTPANVKSLTLEGHAGATSTGTIQVATDPSGAFSIASFALFEGIDTITATTTTADGKTSSAVVHVTTDLTPPTAQILAGGTALDDGAHLAAATTLTVNASDAPIAGVTPVAPTVTLLVDGVAATQPATVSANGGHTAVAIVTDAAGNQTRVERSFSIGALQSGGCGLTGFDPADGSVVTANSTTLVGRSGGAAGVKINNIPALVANGMFAGTVELSVEGANTVTIVCTDASGTPTGTPVSITLNRVTAAPSVTIDNPTELQPFGTSTITVTGSVQNATSVDVNGTPATITGGTYSAANVRLIPGLNILVAHARNNAGAMSIASRRVIGLQNAPAISISWPIDGFTTGTTSIDVSGTYANLNPATLASVPAGTVETHAWSDTTGSFTIHGVPLATGPQAVTVNGRDALNNPASAAVNVTVAAGPSISITSPANNSYLPAGSSIPVSGTYTGADGSQLDVNGTAATANATNLTYSGTAPFSATNPTVITAHVQQPDGNAAIATVLVNQLAANPTVKNTFPENGATAVDPGVMVLVSFSAPMDASTVRNSFTLTGPSNTIITGQLRVDKDVMSFAPATTLTPGATYTADVKTTAKDLAGNPLASEVTFSFTIATTAPSTPPVINAIAGPICASSVTISGTAPANAALVIEMNGVPNNATADATGKYTATLTIPQVSAYVAVRVRVVGQDGTYSPSASTSFQVDCSGAQVLGATYDRSANAITITFSKPVDVTSVTVGASGSVQLAYPDGTQLSGSVAAGSSSSAVVITPSAPSGAADPRTSTINLTVTTNVKDTTGRNLASPFGQTFTVTGGPAPTPSDGSGYISGQILDATNGRALAGASIGIDVPITALKTPNSAARKPLRANTTTVSATTDSTGHYTPRLPEGAYAIHASANGYTDVYRQVVVAAGQGVVPIDIRLTRRGNSATMASTDLTVSHGGDDSLTRKATLTIPSGSAATGTIATVTAVGGQGLPGLLPLGWSPLAAAEIHVQTPAASPLGGATANVAFQLTPDVATSGRAITAVGYDAARDEWDVLLPVVSIDANGVAKVSIALPATTADASGANSGTAAVALVYPDAAPLSAPPAPLSGGTLTGVADPCAAGGCAAFVAKSFTLNPAIVSPTQRSVATLVIDGSNTNPPAFPSGTAIDALVNEELRLVDGSVLTDQPFSTDLVLYRSLDSQTATADFHLAPSTKASQVTLQIGFDHIQILPYPGRLDRGTLIGPAGGRVPSDEQVQIDIPTGATADALHATAKSMTSTDFQQFGSIDGFTIVGGFTLTLDAATQNQQPFATTQLVKSANATFTVDPAVVGSAPQLVLAEVLPQTTFGRLFHLAGTMAAPQPIASSTLLHVSTAAINPAVLPVDGIIRPGQYLLLLAKQPIAFATGTVAQASGPIIAGAGVATNTLGTRDLSRATGVYATPIVAAPAAPFSLTPLHPTLGDGLPYTAAGAPAANTVVPVNLTFAVQAPAIQSVIVTGPTGGVDLTTNNAATGISLSTGVQVTFNQSIDSTSVTPTSITVTGADGQTVKGAASASGTAVSWTLTGTTRLAVNSTYVVTVSGTIRGSHGAPLGATQSYTFSSVTQLTSSQINASKIRITIPDANGISTIIGDPGALPTVPPETQVWSVIAIRRGNTFITQHQTPAGTDGSFRLKIGTCGGNGACIDSVKLTDHIDLEILNAAQNIASVIPLTPFVTEDGKGFLAPSDADSVFTSNDGIVVHVPAGAFSQPTVVHVVPTDKTPLEAVPSFDHDLGFFGGVNLQFDGVANKRLNVEIPVPSTFTPPANELMLGWLGESARGPRIMIVDTITIANNKFTTIDNTAAPASATRARTVLTGKDVKNYLLGVERSGIYSVVDITVPIASGWAIFSGMQQGYDLFWDTLASLYAADFYLVEGRGKIAIPVLSGTPFTIEGVDTTTGFTMFTKQYPNADNGVIASPNPDVTGPYPVFATPSNVQQVDLVDADTYVRNFHLHYDGTNVSIGDNNANETTDLRLPKDSRVQVLNTANGQSLDPMTVNPDGSFNLGAIAATKGDRLILISSASEVNAGTDMSVVFNEPITLSTIDDLRTKITLTETVGTNKIDLTPQVQYNVDSAGRRIQLAMLSGELAAGARYDITLKQTITDLSGNLLGIGVQPGTTNPSGGHRDLVLSFKVRDRAAVLGQFDIQPSSVYSGGTVRDMTQSGGLLFISALDGGLLAYDMSNPAALKPSATGAQPQPLAFVPGRWTDAAGQVITPGFDEHWAVATDHHGRVWSTGFMSNFSVLRSYRVEDFLNAAGSTGGCTGITPLPGALCNYHGSAIIGWRPGYSSSLDLASGTVLSDRVEATPRKMQVILQDDQEHYTFDDFKTTYAPSIVEAYASGFERWNVNVSYHPDTTQPYYLVQRITIENTTRDLRWSVDVPAGQTVSVANVVAIKGDQLTVYRNQRTWGVVSQFGYGVSIFDLNAIDSNSSPNKPSGYQNIRTQIIATRADGGSTCNALVPAPGMIQDLTLSPEAALIPTADSSALVTYATDVHNGVLGVGVDSGWATESAGTTGECIMRTGGVVFYDRSSGAINPRLQAIQTKFASIGRLLNPRYNSISYYRGMLGGNPMDYALIAGGDFGLLVLQVGPPGRPDAGPNQLAGLIWVPSGVFGVRVIPNSHLATMVDGSGRALIVDLTNIDERYDASGNLTTGLFKTAADALNSPSAPFGVAGIDDARILWASDPGFMQNTLAPIVDPNTGIMVAGDLAAKSVRVVPAIDPKIRMVIDKGDAATNGLTEVTGVAPAGFDPRANLLTGPTGSASVFRIEVSLPAGAAKALQDAGSSLELAVESEWTPGVVTAQTPVQYPKAHLRSKARDGNADPRATTFVLHRDLPANVESQVRYQSGATRYVSDWIVAIGDPRASEKWKWTGSPSTADKAAAGCASCDRPASLHNKTEADGVYELWTAGRYISVRPDGAIANNILAGTPYEYLGKSGRLNARFTTTRARKVRPTEVLVPAQNPPVADGMLQETHYVHSGEVETSSVDLDAGGRAGVNVVIARHYRSRTIGGTELGEGWDSPMFRFLLPMPNGDVEYHDGSGEIWKFHLDSTTGALTAPKGLFLKLIHTPRGFSMLDQKWRIAEFNDLGQLISESDEFYSPSQSDSGNIIRYLYDENGKLKRIIDPLGRTTTLTYDDNDRLSDVSTDWRHRSLKYHHDTFGRLTSVDLPEVKALSGLPTIYDHSGSNRPSVHYGYDPTLTPPQPNEPPQSQTYTDFAEFLGNLKSITDPEQVRTGGPARVTFTYDQTTGTARDRNLTQVWASGETAYFEPDSHGYLDVLGQLRSYTLTNATDYDGRRHIESKRLIGVDVMDAAAAGLPDSITPTLTPTAGINHSPLETKYSYDVNGLVTRTTFPNGMVEDTDHWVAANGAPGFVLKSKKQTGPNGDFIETDFGFDTAANATANLSKLGRRDNNTPNFIYRDSQTPSRSHATIESNDTGVQSRAAFNKNGQIETAANGDGPGNTSIVSKIDYYPTSTSNPIESGRPWHISRGNGNEIHSTTAYSMTGDGVETETTTDDIRGVVTTITKDVDGHMIERKVQAPSVTTALGAAPAVTDETFGYNADGKLVYQTRLQGGIPIVTTITYDALGRQTDTETSGMKLLNDPTISGSEIDGSLKTRTKYEIASHRITEYAPFRTDETTAPRTVKTLDTLGRTVQTLRTGPTGAATIKSVTYYDAAGKIAYESDVTRSATLTQNDAFGRPIASIRCDGTRTQVTYDAWDAPIETVGFKKKTGATLEPVAHSKTVYSEDGRLRLSAQQIDGTGRARGTAMSWQQGDAITTQRVGEIAFSDTAIGATTTVRVQQSVRDSAGRIIDKISGESTGPEALVDPSKTFAEMRVTSYVADLAMQTETVEPRAGRKSSQTISYDGLGRPIVTIEGGGAYVGSAIYDEAGNAIITKSAGMQQMQMAYDARGLLLDQQFNATSGGAHIHRIYDELGNLRQYIDESATPQTTYNDVDELGRIIRTRYPDGTSEETVFENGTGFVQARRDRAGRWVSFKYDDVNGGRLIEEDHAGNGPTPVAADAFIRYSYDDAGRVTRIASAESAIEYDNFDFLGRPQITRTIRYTKTGCIPAIVACGSGLTATPQIAEEYTQGHVWSVFDGERSRWRLPVVGASLPSTEVDTPWRNWVDEQRDAGGNLTAQQEALSQTGTAAGDVISQSIGRGAGRLAQRQRGNLLTKYGYADVADASSAVVPTTPASPGAPLGGLGRAESVIGSLTVAGSEITVGPKKLIASAKDLGLDARKSGWQYTDDRGWLQQSILLQRDGATSNLPTANNGFADPALVKSRDITPPRIGVTDLPRIPNANALVPLTWTADQISNNSEIQHRNFTNAGLPAGDQTLTWSSGRRDSNGTWTLSYDDRGRVVAKETTDRRIVYDYDPNDRVVGRIAYQKDASGAWTIETRSNVLARDALPAETTFVWDPIADRLVAMYDSAAVRNTTNQTAETGLIRQYVHGESSYDDPVEVLIANAAGQAPQRFLPILDEAGTGSLQAVADGSGKLIERVLYADSYGDAPRYLQGAVADRIDVGAAGGQRTISIHFTEAVDATTIASGAAITALDASGTSVATLPTAPALSDPHTLTWTVDNATWSAFTQGAQSVRIAVNNSLRFPAWGTTPLQPVADWESALGRAASAPDTPLVKIAQVSDFNAAGTIYDVPDLYLVGHTTSISNLLFDFHGLPFRDPADGLIFARARWFDPSTSSFVSDDPLGYKDSSNLYAYAANNPVGRIDPTGETFLQDAWDLTKAGVGVVAGVVVGVVETAVDTVKGAFMATYNGVGAMAYEITGNQMYREQYDAHMRTTEAINNTIGHPINAAQAMWNGLKQPFEKAAAQGDTFGVGFELGKQIGAALAPIAEEKAVEALSNGLLSEAKTGAQLAMRGEAEVEAQTARAAMESRVPGAEAAERAFTQEATELETAGEELRPCGFGGHSLLGSTEIATPNGLMPISALHVGDRVESTNIDRTHPDGWTAVNDVNWHVLHVRMGDPERPGDLYDVDLLRPVEWIVANEAYPGNAITLPTRPGIEGTGYVVGVSAAPRIDRGSGRVVLATYAHHDELVAIKFEGVAEVLQATPWHRFYSVDRQDWVAVGELKIGERIRTKSGAAVIDSMEHMPTNAEVFDIEVEGDHSYYVGTTELLSHNNNVRCGGAFPHDPEAFTEMIGVEPTRGVTPDGTRRFTWEPNADTKIRFESHPDGLQAGDPGFNPRHHGEHYHIETKPSNLSWGQAKRRGLITKAHPVGYTPGSGTGFLPGEAFPGN